MPIWRKSRIDDGASGRIQLRVFEHGAREMNLFEVNMFDMNMFEMNRFEMKLFEVTIPEGLLTIARRFNAGTGSQKKSSPIGTADAFQSCLRHSIDFATRPAAEAAGY